jgi:hypothetical protein
MKKIGMILVTAALLFSFAACGGGAKKTEDAAEKTEVKTEVAAEAAAPQETYVEQTPAEALKAFSDYAKEYGEAFNALPKNVANYQKLARQSQQKVADMERLKIDFNANQLKEYEKALEIVRAVNSGGQ